MIHYFSYMKSNESLWFIKYNIFKIIQIFWILLLIVLYV